MRTRINIQLGISIIIAASVISVFAFFFTIIKNKNEHTSNVLAVLEDKIVKKNNAASLFEKMSEVKSIQSVVAGHLVDQTKIDGLVNYLENLGTEARTELVVKDITTLTTNKNTVAIKVSATGDFPSVLKTIALLENAPYQIHVTSSYVYKDAGPVEIDAKGKPKLPSLPRWRIDISFTILSS
jgi:hypothetical protein